MRFITDLGRLADSVRDASAGLSANPMHPILAGMLVTVDKDVTFTSFDGDVMFTARHDDPGHAEPGTAVVPGRLFADIIRNLPGDTVEFHVKDSKAYINAGNVKFALPLVLDAKTYPGGLTPAPPHGEVEGSVLANAIARVASSVSKVPANPVFNCLLAEPDGDCLALVATDRSRLACARVPWTRTGGAQGSLIPGWAAEKFGKVALGKVALGWDSRCFTMSAEGLEVVSRGIQGEYVKWRDILPETTEGVTVDTEVLAAAIRQASLMLARTDPIQFRFDGNDLYVTGTGLYGECESYLEVGNPGEGTPEVVLFGLGVILDGLAGCGEQAVLGFSGTEKPVKLYSDGFRYVMAPRRRI